MSRIAPPMFSFALSGPEALVPRTPLILQAYHDLLVSNHERLARWEPWAVQPPVLGDTRAFLDASARTWIAGSELPVAIAVCQDGQWRLTGRSACRSAATAAAERSATGLTAAMKGAGWHGGRSRLFLIKPSAPSAWNASVCTLMQATSEAAPWHAAWASWRKACCGKDSLSRPSAATRSFAAC